MFIKECELSSKAKTIQPGGSYYPCGVFFHFPVRPMIGSPLYRENGKKNPSGKC